MVTRNNRQKIFREVLASLVASRLTASELRQLADLLQDSEFTYRLGQSVYDLSKSIDPRSSAEWQEELDFENEDGAADKGLVELAYSVVQRRRLPKRSLMQLVKSCSPRSASRISEEMSSRDILEIFFASATTGQTKNFLRDLGMDVAEDPYLEGISGRSRG